MLDFLTGAGRAPVERPPPVAPGAFAAVPLVAPAVAPPPVPPPRHAGGRPRGFVESAALRLHRTVGALRRQSANQAALISAAAAPDRAYKVVEALASRAHERNHSKIDTMMINGEVFHLRNLSERHDAAHGLLSRALVSHVKAQATGIADIYASPDVDAVINSSTVDDASMWITKELADAANVQRDLQDVVRKKIPLTRKHGAHAGPHHSFDIVCSPTFMGLRMRSPCAVTSFAGGEHLHGT